MLIIKGGVNWNKNKLIHNLWNCTLIVFKFKIQYKLTSLWYLYYKIKNRIAFQIRMKDI